jgi:RHS repeat-associated protein
MKRGVILLLFLVVCIPISYAEVIDIPNVENSEPLKDASGAKKFVYVGNNIVASFEDSEVKYYHQGRLSNRVVSDSSGNKVGEFLSLPFGQKVGNSGVDYPFTGKEEGESALYYFGARYYDDNLGRFISVDPVKNNHAYSYVRNNPMNYIDPDGMDRFGIQESNAPLGEGIGRDPAALLVITSPTDKHLPEGIYLDKSIEMIDSNGLVFEHTSFLNPLIVIHETDSSNLREVVDEALLKYDISEIVFFAHGSKKGEVAFGQKKGDSGNYVFYSEIMGGGRYLELINNAIANVGIGDVYLATCNGEFCFGGENQRSFRFGINIHYSEGTAYANIDSNSEDLYIESTGGWDILPEIPDVLSEIKVQWPPLPELEMREE